MARRRLCTGRWSRLGWCGKGSGKWSVVSGQKRLRSWRVCLIAIQRGRGETIRHLMDCWPTLGAAVSGALNEASSETLVAGIGDVVCVCRRIYAAAGGCTGCGKSGVASQVPQTLSSPVPPIARESAARIDGQTKPTPIASVGFVLSLAIRPVAIRLLHGAIQAAELATIWAKEAGSRLAPPTSAPSMSSSEQRLAALSGLTEPP